MKIPERQIASVDASQGRRRNWLKGLLVGLAAGVGSGFAFKVDPDNCGPDTANLCSRGQALAGGTVLFGALGAGIGALIKSERWTPLDPPGRR